MRLRAVGIGLLVGLAAGLAASPGRAAEAPGAELPVGEVRSGQVGGIDLARLLEDLHADAGKYVAAIRPVTTVKSKVSTRAIYSGIVRIGGTEPRLSEDAPSTGPGARNDIVLFPGATDPVHTEGWLRLILDHEYFHARHLAHGWRTPTVDFGDPEFNRHYYEAVAWGYVLERARAGTYGALGVAETREVQATYARHLDAFRDRVLQEQPAAWSHYRRFLYMPDAEGGDGALRAALGR